MYSKGINYIWSSFKKLYACFLRNKICMYCDILIELSLHMGLCGCQWLTHDVIVAPPLLNESSCLNLWQNLQFIILTKYCQQSLYDQPMLDYFWDISRDWARLRERERERKKKREREIGRERVQGSTTL